MTGAAAQAPSAWSDAALAAAIFAVDPAGIGGACLHAPPGPVRESWLTLVRGWMPPMAPTRRVPLGIGDGRLLGGLDLAATLRAGRPVAERGLLAESDGGVAIIAMAERLSGASASRIAQVLDTGEVATARDGVACRSPARLGVIALDEGLSEDERPPAALLERLALLLDLSAIGPRQAISSAYALADIATARSALPRITMGSAVLEALCGTAMALGIASIRAPMQAMRVACIVAALAGRDEVNDADAAVAARLVFAPRATRLPAPPADPAPPEDAPDGEPPEQPDRSASEEQESESRSPEGPSLEDLVLAAAQAAIPPDLLAQLGASGGPRRAGPAGPSGVLQKAAARGRPAGIRAGEPRGGSRLNLVETLRAAAPWQPLRRRESAGNPASDDARVNHDALRVAVRREDFRVTRYQQRTETTIIFVVDASRSSAVNRLAEAKGAVELLLADCYVRRDQVALLAFRGRGAELLLPPTRSLVRAKRELAGLPGGGGTPLAAGLDGAVRLADAVRRRGQTPVIVLLTDGRANVARDGTPGRERAEADALAAGRAVRAAGVTAMLVDTAQRPQPAAARFAREMGARYLPLPYASAATLSAAVRATAAESAPARARTA